MTKSRSVLSLLTFGLLAGMMSDSKGMTAPERAGIKYASGRISGWGFIPNKHPKMSWVKQRREAKKRRNIAAHSKH